jgi:hypothetical protein
MIEVGPVSSFSGLGTKLPRVDAKEASSSLFGSCSYYVDEGLHAEWEECF